MGCCVEMVLMCPIHGKGVNYRRTELPDTLKEKITLLLCLITGLQSPPAICTSPLYDEKPKFTLKTENMTIAQSQKALL